MSIYDFTRQAVEAGGTDPDEIAADYLAKALTAEDPEAWLLQPVRMAVGSAFSSLQKAYRGEQRGGKQAGGDGAGVHPTDDSQIGDGPGAAIPDLTRQSHSDSQLWLPSTRKWIAFADATIEQIEDAIEYYKGRRTATTQSIAELRGAIKEIRAVPGATCLRDVWAAREQKTA